MKLQQFRCQYLLFLFLARSVTNGKPECPVFTVFSYLLIFFVNNY